ncbi:hypothetical protein HHI36_020014 [Cryptolaemus montrouzieri]|uniref:Uncharacterized protein n=1 Tax=Cryptolaemus montrouzieri TaxID=559131 RepID=A0ABD2N9S1_9CUCU
MVENEDQNSGHDISITNMKSRSRRRKHNCPYCGVPVNNFARHLQRKHNDETEVEQFMSMDKNDPLKRKIIEKIRKEGDFFSGKYVPVKKRSKCDGEYNRNLIPCIHCKGYYSRRTLRLHVKRCIFNKQKAESRQRHLSDGQTMLAGNFSLSDPLRTSGVLRSLRADDISLVAKKDKIICEMARKYLKSYKKRHLVCIAKRNMRRLARFLIEARKIENDSSLSLDSILHPSKFKLIVAAVKRLTNYNSKNKRFCISNIVMEMGPLIKKAIAAACSLELLKDMTSPRLDVLDTLKRMIDEEWLVKFSTEDIQNVNQFTRSTVIQLTEDLVKLNTYLDDLLREAKNDLLLNNEDENAFKELIEGAYCSLLLFNRRRVDELQGIHLSTYINHINDEISSEDFVELLTPAENMYFNKIKTLIISDKKGRRVPVLFEEYIEQAIDLALRHRDHFFKSRKNIFLFGLTDSKEPINGREVFVKHVLNALGDSNKTVSLTSTKLRKHLATITQIIKMDHTELDQLATFMGHTKDTYEGWYRLPTDVHQTVKISKILLMSENRSIQEFKGRNLDDLNVNVDIVEDDVTEDEEEIAEFKEEILEIKEEIAEIQEVDKQTTAEYKWGNIEKKKRVLRKWTKEEKQAAESYFSEHLRDCRAPKKAEVVHLLDKYPNVFKGRKWESVKIFICNEYNRRKQLSEG